MSEENKRYFWMKFQRDFFKSLRIKRLRKLAGGDTFTIIYLKMQLLSIIDGGHLTFKGVFPSFEEEMAEEIQEDVENIKVTIQFLLGCGLMEQTGDDYFLPYAAENIGSECASAERMRRLRKRESSQCDTNVTKELRMSNGEIDIEKEKDKEKDIKHKHGTYMNVLLTDVEFEKLKSEFPADYEKRIEDLSYYIKSYGKSYKDHLATIRNWARKDKQRQETSQNKPNNGFSKMATNDYDFDAIEKMLGNK